MARDGTPLIAKARFHLKLWAVLVSVAFAAGVALGFHLSRSSDEMSDRGQHQVFTDETLRNDWAGLAVHAPGNATLAAPAAGENRVVLFGDSITAYWIKVAPEFFNGKPYVDRGIGGQTTPQMLVRFQQDVVALHPAVVVILGGVNDLSGLTGPATPEMIENNLKSMVEIARASNIRPVLASILPNAKHTVEIATLNRWIETYAKAHGLVFLDYTPALVDEKGGLRSELTKDGLHPNHTGYEIMGPLAETAIKAALVATPSATTPAAPATIAPDSAKPPDSTDAR